MTSLLKRSWSTMTSVRAVAFQETTSASHVTISASAFGNFQAASRVLRPAAYARCSASTEKPASTAGLRTCATRCCGRQAVKPNVPRRRGLRLPLQDGLPWRGRRRRLHRAFQAGGSFLSCRCVARRRTRAAAPLPRNPRARSSRGPARRGVADDDLSCARRLWSFLTNVGKRTCRAAADFSFRYRAAFLGEGGGDEGCIEPSESGPGP